MSFKGYGYDQENNDNNGHNEYSEYNTYSYDRDKIEYDNPYLDNEIYSQPLQEEKDAQHYKRLNPFLEENNVNNANNVLSQNMNNQNAPTQSNTQSNKNFINPYSNQSPIKLQDLTIQKIPSDILRDNKIKETLIIDNVKTEFYQKGQCYNHYYGWVNLETPENGARDIKQQLNRLQSLTRKSLIAAGTLFALFIIFLNTTLPEYYDYLTMTALCIVPMVYITAKRNIEKDRNKTIIEMFYNGEVKEEPHELRMSRLETNKTSPFKK